ncbi:hypothetical protein R1flu_011126 [Riccia fluitans]|uniref:Uncharacterized protein n=1 Tax=Riccia fluitans TaxID=41844 RepID=A0ABD1Z7Z9_9MARC
MKLKSFATEINGLLLRASISWIRTGAGGKNKQTVFCKPQQLGSRDGAKRLSSGSRDVARRPSSRMVISIL